MNNDIIYQPKTGIESKDGLIYLIFASSAVREFNQQELAELQQQAALKNQKLGITGQLIYDEGNFLSVLEGQTDTVQQLYQVISQDQRHRGLILIHEDTISKRAFSNWSMDYQKPNHQAGRRLPISSAIGELIDRYGQN